jgi:hypothetical protein
MNLQELLTKLETPIVIRPTRRMTQGELETYLDKAADILRGNADHSEFRGYVFALLFYKRISDCYEEEVRTQVDALAKAGMPRDQAILLARDPQNHHFTVPEHAAWADVARTAKGQLGQALDDAMLSIERANAHRQNNFDGILTGKIDFNKQDELPRDKLVNLINHFGSQTFDRAHVSDDLFGNAYEYLIRNFASKAGKSSGEFYTPAEVGFLMAEVLQPRAGMAICDWASGSGGLLLQCIRILRIQIQAEDGLFCCFHGGVDWRCAQNLLPRGSKVVVETERPVTAGGRRYVPDIKVLCARTGRPILLIEVWHTHAVSRKKRRAYNELGLPWIEVKSWHVLQRFRSRPLPILDWGGKGMPDGPFQGMLFDQEEPVPSRPTSRKPRRTEGRRAWHPSGSAPPARTLGMLFDDLVAGRSLARN